MNLRAVGMTGKKPAELSRLLEAVKQESFAFRRERFNATPWIGYGTSNEEEKKI